jgi:hypothetical protein
MDSLGSPRSCRGHDRPRTPLTHPPDTLSRKGRGVLVQALITAGIIDRTDDGKILFPYDAVHVDFMLWKAA